MIRKHPEFRDVEIASSLQNPEGYFPEFGYTSRDYIKQSWERLEETK